MEVSLELKITSVEPGEELPKHTETGDLRDSQYGFMNWATARAILDEGA